jgi:hypothetical protein
MEIDQMNKNGYLLLTENQKRLAAAGRFRTAVALELALERFGHSPTPQRPVAEGQ